MSEQVDMAKAIELYVAARALKAEMEAKHKLEIAKVEEAMEDAQAVMVSYLRNNDQTAVRAAAGLATLVTNTTVYVEDKESFVDWVKSTGNVELMEVRVAKTNSLQYLEENGSLPPGISQARKYAVRVTAKR